MLQSGWREREVRGGSRKWGVQDPVMGEWRGGGGGRQMKEPESLPHTDWMVELFCSQEIGAGLMDKLRGPRHSRWREKLQRMAGSEGLLARCRHHLFIKHSSSIYSVCQVEGQEAHVGLRHRGGRANLGDAWVLRGQGGMGFPTPTPSCHHRVDSVG